MKDRIPGYKNLIMEIGGHNFRIKCATIVLRELMSNMKRQAKACNKSKCVSQTDAAAVKGLLREIDRHLDIIASEKRQAEEAFSRFFELHKGSGE